MGGAKIIKSIINQLLYHAFGWHARPKIPCKTNSELIETLGVWIVCKISSTPAAQLFLNEVCDHCSTEAPSQDTDDDTMNPGMRYARWNAVCIGHCIKHLSAILLSIYQPFCHALNGMNTVKSKEKA